ncbi:MAG: ATP-dependent zinc metalloprotease FtsH [Planctomycetaceae bacterium]|jgi:cell division protease FtsH|nr:ATP-dependent zinc metalloprotease FtsH [Planctomycetaceae bacterium]MBT5125806.1 ATP-dependent zinc metalloprotease FtsH [Planctomycetaceae bacterium]MBT5883671.1 ATP-dependent zinc metalloprotease FtsH [Planctomycetaceae bacterium]MBT6849140.1 ATP-dependent zinc metalloprotease FtsH [Planctomycetaceae bacterium]MBT7916067.1 ATP-dependent zinc metalloprotease FtsH [Planctomycetaceae bacterium]
MEQKPQDPQNRPQRGGLPRIWVIVFIILLISMFVFRTPSPTKVRYSDFREYLTLAATTKNNHTTIIDRGDIKLVELATSHFATVTFKEAQTVTSIDGEEVNEQLTIQVDIPPNDSSRRQLEQLLEGNVGGPIKLRSVDYVYLPPDDTASFLLLIAVMLPIVILVFFWISYRRSQSQFMGGGFLSGFGKSTAKRYDKDEHPITFKDVAGQKAAKADLLEIVEFLQAPEKYQKLGGRVPKGVLLNGPPGTGKTLLAKAVAGEAGAPFFSINGSEFIQMFVGVGASRVRDLFQQAKEAAPAIIFIDEIDAVGRQRGAGVGGGHDEREQTLNQILSEMDGFSTTDSAIVIAATNRPDVLDPALLRPGRFDRHVTVGLPTQKGRAGIFKVHVREVPLSDDVDLDRLAAGTVGLTGADIRNMVNEAALWAARHDKTCVDMTDFDYARDKILMGAKREEMLTAEDKEKTAYHEAGHTLASWFLKGADRVHKVTIIPRGRSLGSTQMLPEEDRVSMSQTQLEAHLVVLLAGRAAEHLIYDETTVGAENDLERATSMARRMVTRWGMSEKLGPVNYKLSDEDPFLGREIHAQRQFSEHTMELIDEEVSRFLHRASQRAGEFLVEYRQQLEIVTRELLEREELSEMDLIEIIGPSVHPMPEPLSDNATTGDSDNSSKHADEQDHTNSTDEITAASAQTELAASQDSVDTTQVPSEQIANAIDSNETDNSDTTGPATT